MCFSVHVQLLVGIDYEAESLEPVVMKSVLILNLTNGKMLTMT